MGQDKALLPVAGRSLIEHLVDQLRPHFAEILVSANDPERYAFLGLKVVADRHPDVGPMEAVASALEQSPCEQNFIVGQLNTLWVVPYWLCGAPGILATIQPVEMLCRPGAGFQDPQTWGMLTLEG